MNSMGSVAVGWPVGPLLGTSASWAAVAVFGGYIAIVFVLAWLSNRLLRERSFLSEYFLGSRSLGMWAFALTFAATSASGGTFTGFPSKIYVHGWILGLWIASYLVYPICTMGLLGKRLNQVARISGAITIPDILRDRFRSPALGLIAVALIVFFMSFNLVAQFKSGSEILRTLLRDVEVFRWAADWVAHQRLGIPGLAAVSADYLICLAMFASCVIVYTTYGGFHAVVWTDVVQGIFMVIGVMIMLPLALSQVGGMRQANRELANMSPPRMHLLEFQLREPLPQAATVTSPWFLVPSSALGEPPASAGRPESAGGSGRPRLMRTGRDLAIPAGTTQVSYIRAVELTTDSEIERQLQRLVDQGEIDDVQQALRTATEQGELVWLNRELRELCGSRVPVNVTLSSHYTYGDGRTGCYVSGPGPAPPALPASPGTIEVRDLQPGWEVQLIDSSGALRYARRSFGGTVRISADSGRQQVRVVRGDGTAQSRELDVPLRDTVSWNVDAGGPWQAGSTEPRSVEGDTSLGFLPLGLAISFFFMWAISGTGQPGHLVRLMAFRDTKTLRRGIFAVACYYSLIYLPLVVIFVCARILLPGMELESDRVMPQMAVTLTANVGQAWLAGLLVAAPFAAVMSTVDSFLLVISSALVRDIYQRNVNQRVSEQGIKRLCYVCTLVVGAAATLGAINPPAFLQDIIVYTGSGLAACFLAPIALALYWPRSNRAGCLSGMVGGFAAHLAMYLAGWFVNGSFYRPVQLWGLDPIIVGLAVSFLAAFLVSYATPPPPADLVRRYFWKRTSGTPAKGGSGNA